MEKILLDAAGMLSIYPYNPLFTREVQTAFRGLKQHMESGEKRISCTVNIATMGKPDRVSFIPLPVKRTENELIFDWFPENAADSAAVFVPALLRALDRLTIPETDRLAESYPSGTEVRYCEFGTETPIEGKVKFVDEIGQIHIVKSDGTSFVAIPGLDRI